MAVIRQIESRGTLPSVGGPPSVQVDQSPERALQNFGGALQDAGNQIAAQGRANQKLEQDIELRRERASMQMQEFRTNQDFLRFKDQFAGQFADMAVNMDPSGEGFTQGISKSFNEEAEKYLQTVPDALKPRFNELVATSRQQFMTKAAANEVDQRNSWYRTNVEETQGRLAAQVFEEPGYYDAALDEGYRTIEASGLPQTEKQALRDGWAATLQAAKAENYLRTNPGKVAGIDVGNSEAARMVKAIASVESSGNPNAESGKGASGLMQVMPDTGREIADELGDPTFPRDGSDAAVKAYLKRPDVSVRYGSHYFSKMLNAYEGDVEAALVAYNGGPERAERWINSGRDDSVIPAETRDYKRKVMSAYGRTDTANVPTRNIELKAGDGVNLTGMNPVVLGKWQQVQNLFGEQVRITSGFRDPNYNRRVGGAKKSQHIHGGAVDIDVSGMPKEKRLELIRLASANGFTGIGVYGNSLHLDIGPRRAWGPSYGNDSVPSWAKEAVNEHLAGKAAPMATQQGGQQGTVYLDPEFSEMDLADRIKLYDNAVSAVNTQRKAAETRQSALYEEHKDAVTLGIETGDVRSEASILNDTVLNDGDKATALRRFRTVNEERLTSEALIRDIVEGNPTARLNPFDSDDRSRGDKAYESLLEAIEPEQAEIATRSFIESTGYVPKKAVADVRQLINSGNVQNVAAGLQQAVDIEASAGRGLEAVENGAEIKKAATSYDHYRFRLGYPAEEAAKRYMDAMDPARQRERDALLESDTIKKALKNIDETDVRDLWNTVGPNAFSGYKVGENADATAVMVADYRDILTESVVDANGDMDLAKEYASDRFKRIYGPSTLTTAEDTIVKYPPEVAYPPVNGSHDYIREQALGALANEGVTTEEVFLQPYLDTEADIKSGAPPHYQLYYTDESGKMQMYHLPFYAEPGIAQQSAAADRQRSVEQSEQRMRDSRQRLLERGQTRRDRRENMQESGGADQATQDAADRVRARREEIIPRLQEGMPTEAELPRVVIENDTLEGAAGRRARRNR